MALVEGVAGETPTVANTLPLTRAGISGVADTSATSAALWVQRSLAAGDALAYKFVPGVGLYLKNASGTTADAATNAAGIASGKGLAVTNYGATGTTPTFPNAAALADADAVPTTTKVGAVLYGYDGATLRLVRTIDAGNGLTTGLLGQGGYAYTGTTWNRLNTASSSNAIDASGGAGFLAVAGWDWNGATWDRHRGNISTAVLTSSARTVATSTGALVNYNGRGIQCDLAVTAKAAATTLSIQLLNPAGGTIATSGAIAAAAGAGYSVAFYPGILAAAYSSNGQGLSVVVPRDYILVVTPSDANSVTYSLNIQTLF